MPHWHRQSKLSHKIVSSLFKVKMLSQDSILHKTDVLCLMNINDNLVTIYLFSGILDKDLWAVFEKRNAYFEYALSMLPDNSAGDNLEESESSSSDDDDDDDDDDGEGYDDDDDEMKGEEEGDDDDMEVDDEEDEEEGDDDEEENGDDDEEEDGGEDIKEKTEEPARPCHTEGQHSKTKG